MSAPPIFNLIRGKAPLLISLPHVGTHIPAELQPRFTPRALRTEDTDWHLETLYAFAREFDATILSATHSRYVIDLNRPPDDQPMYPGASNTELCPTRFFTGEPLYREDATPDTGEIDRRRERYWRPYHGALAAELERLHRAHGYVVHWDGHSIRSKIPWLFDGTLPDLNLGTANGTSCDPELRQRLIDALDAQHDYSVAIDGRFKGGYTTRHYGRPTAGVHTVQMEMCQSTYMDEAEPFAFDADRANRVSRVLHALIEIAASWRPRELSAGISR